LGLTEKQLLSKLLLFLHQLQVQMLATKPTPMMAHPKFTTFVTRESSVTLVKYHSTQTQQAGMS